LAGTEKFVVFLRSFPFPLDYDRDGNGKEMLDRDKHIPLFNNWERGSGGWY
jgi:hypothetical protein